MKIHNFSAGPSILPKEVMEQASQGVLELNNIGLSILEISHRSKDFMSIIEEAQFLVKKLLKVPDNYHILFLQGGASTQFAMVPLNLLPAKGLANYIDTGTWTTKAIDDAKKLGDVEIIASSKNDHYKYIPKTFSVNKDASYVHICTNNTIYGTEWHQIPQFSIPVVADMSSNIFSRPINISNYDLIYAGAQKNLGPAGATIVIIKDGISGKVERSIPAMLDYQKHISKASVYNTPSVFAIYVCLLTLRWLDSNGGIEAIKAKNIQKANLLYEEIDRNPLFYGLVEKEDRSRMNVTFRLKEESKNDHFLKMMSERGISGIKGHRVAGGFRASIYNAMPIESVKHLIHAMQDFENTI